jgi:hypothetical protein
MVSQEKRILGRKPAMRSFHSLRYIIFGLFAIICFSTAKAQDAGEVAEEPSIAKGKVLLGSYFNFSFSTIDKVRPSRNTSSDVVDIGINITTGKMLSDHWGVILVGGYAKTSSLTPIPTTSIIFEEVSESYSLAAGVRYYALISDATYFFVQGGLRYSRGNTSADEFNGTAIENIKLKTHGFAVGISPGISYFMTNKLSTEISIGLLGYTVVKGEDENGNSTEVRSFQSLLYLNSISLGFVFYL